jgi:hypothetical protein
MSKKSLQLSELELREALRLHISQTNDATALMFEEWNIESGQSRIDMAVVTPSSLTLTVLIAYSIRYMPTIGHSTTSIL